MTKGGRRDGEHEVGLAQDNRVVPASPLRKDTPPRGGGED